MRPEDKVDGAEIELERRDTEEAEPLAELDRDNMGGQCSGRRRKLRLVLSEVDSQAGGGLTSLPQVELPVVRQGGDERGELVGLLQVMLAQAINKQARNAATQLRETLRCLSLFD